MVSSFLGFGSYIDGVPPPTPLPTAVHGCPADLGLSGNIIGSNNATTLDAILETTLASSDLFTTTSATSEIIRNATSLLLTASDEGVTDIDDSWET
jgi:hypothetical protein